jgi:hypothetical protein
MTAAEESKQKKGAAVSLDKVLATATKKAAKIRY